MNSDSEMRNSEDKEKIISEMIKSEDDEEEIVPEMNKSEDEEGKIISEMIKSENEEKIISEMINSEDEEKIISENIISEDEEKITSEAINSEDEHGILSNGEHQNLTLTVVLTTSSINKLYSNKKPLPNNTTDVLVENDTIPDAKNSFKRNAPKDPFIKNRDSILLKIALSECLLAIGDLDDDGYSYDKLLEDEIANLSKPQVHSNSPTLKNDDELLSNVRDCNYNCDIEESIHTSDNEINKVRTIQNIKSETKSLQETAVNEFSNMSSEADESKNTLMISPQKGICLTLPSNIEKCIECRVHQIKNILTTDYDNNLCRFDEFRLLTYDKSRELCVAGFPETYTNLKSVDLIKWLPNKQSTPSCLNVQVSKKILECTGGQLCKFIQDEKEALKLDLTNEQKKKHNIWKKSVNDMREMCDICKTSIFNYHWTCGECGFIVCFDCFQTKLNKSRLTPLNTSEKQDIENWLLCSNQKEHKVHQLTITQKLSCDVLDLISELMHSTCIDNNISISCDCIQKLKNSKLICLSNDSVFDPFLNGNNGNNISDKITETTSQSSFLSNEEDLTSKPKKFKSEAKDCTSTLLLITHNKSNVSHMLLYGGLVLNLLDAKDDGNYELFQEQWKHGRPVLVSNVCKNLNSELWHPESFSRDFGDQKNNIIDYATSKVLYDYPMCKFWNGFENIATRLCDEQGNPMLLKLIDWPSADFAETMPDRFEDFMNCLPLKEYTLHNGQFNLISHLPECFVRPDLGPKIYSAYGNIDTQFEKNGTTNLHFNVLDAVNVLVYVAIANNGKQNDYNWYVREALKIIKEADCDDIILKRINLLGEIPGAIWHIYHESDVKAIKDLLIKVSIEHGTLLEDCSDPIHNQSLYLDNYLRDRLFKEYGVKGYPVVQFYGDAVFIPAGALYQIRNLQNCIQVTEYFVSPENVRHCNVSGNHTIYKNKLQFKNIVFHAVKDSISVLMKT